MGAFKFRGAYNALAQFTPEQRRGGVNLQNLALQHMQLSGVEQTGKGVNQFTPIMTS